MRRNLFRNLTIIFLVLLVGCLGGLMFYQSKIESGHSKHISDIMSQVRPYEAEIKALQKEIEAVDTSITVKNDIALSIIGYEVDGNSDFDMIKTQANTYGYRPVIVFEPNLAYNDAVIDALDRSRYDLIFTGSPANPDILAGAMNLRDVIKTYDYGIKDPACFLLKNSQDNKNNLKAVNTKDYNVILRHKDKGKPGTLQNGKPCFNYCLISDDTFDMKARMKEETDNKGITLFVFNLSEGKLSSEAINGYIDQIKALEKDKKLKMTTIEDAAKIIKKLEEAQQSTREEANAVLKEKQERIEEIQKEIDALYEKWDEK